MTACGNRTYGVTRPGYRALDVAGAAAQRAHGLCAQEAARALEQLPVGSAKAGHLQLCRDNTARRVRGCARVGYACQHTTHPLPYKTEQSLSHREKTMHFLARGFHSLPAPSPGLSTSLAGLARRCLVRGRNHIMTAITRSVKIPPCVSEYTGYLRLPSLITGAQSSTPPPPQTGYPLIFDGVIRNRLHIIASSTVPE